jgi:predicted helicase
LLPIQGTPQPESVRQDKSLALAGILPELFEYRLWKTVGGGSAVDPYQVSTDKRSGITSDPNRPDDPNTSSASSARSSASASKP